MKDLKVAIVCDWLTSWGGAERVILALHRMYPEAAIFTSIYDPTHFPDLAKADVRTSFLQKFPGAKKNYQRYFSQMPLAFESFDLDEFDVVISSSHSCAKGVITRPDTLHVSYCHSPPRYLWDGSHQYLKEYPWPGLLKRTFIPSLLRDMRLWDRATADRVDRFVANSAFVARRIQKYYRRDAEVIYPPVSMFPYVPSVRGDAFLAVGRLIPYKKFDLIVQAFNALKLPLKIVGVGNQLGRLKKMAGSTIEFLGMVSEEELHHLYATSRALIFPQIEDFGITPIEAMSFGCPVIAYAEGGALETVRDGVSGLYFNEQSEDALIRAVRRFEVTVFDPLAVRTQAERFDASVFSDRFSSFVGEAWDSFCNSSI